MSTNVRYHCGGCPSIRKYQENGIQKLKCSIFGNRIDADNYACLIGEMYQELKDARKAMEDMEAVDHLRELVDS